MHPEQIKANMRIAGVTPAALADELGISRSTVSQVISGVAVSARVRNRIADVVGVPVSKLWSTKPSLRRTKCGTGRGKK